jgi:hypothetical protein
MLGKLAIKSVDLDEVLVINRDVRARVGITRRNIVRTGTKDCSMVISDLGPRLKKLSRAHL